MRRDVQLVFPRADRFTLTWMVVLIVIWIAVTAAYRWLPFGHQLYDYLTFDLGDLFAFRLWTFLTYAFVHDVGAPFDLLLNCLMLYFFAPQMRERWGHERFVVFVVLTALGGAVAAAIAGLLGFGSMGAGAGAIVIGIFAAWGLTYPDRTIYVAFVLPMRGIHMVYLTAFVIVLEMLAVATSAALHAGGLVVAVLLVMGAWRQNRARLFWDNLLTFLRIRKKPKLTLVPQGGGKQGGGKKGPDSFVH